MPKAAISAVADLSHLRDLIRDVTQNAAAIGDLASRTFDEDQQVALCEALLRICAKVAFDDYGKAIRIFAAAEAFGTHFLPCNHYSPIPGPGEIDQRIYQRRYDVLPGLRIDREAELAAVAAIAAYAGELAGFEDYDWNNPLFPPLDALVLYGMVRHLQPTRFIEVGSGYSTGVTARALARNGQGHLTCIEPDPSAGVQAMADAGTVDLHIARVQDIPPSLFETLERGDVLFIDSTHVAKAGSDVMHEVFQILPALKPGVWVHIHDIFLPFDYPRHWIEERKVFWNEQYLLMAFLAFNDRFALRLANFDLCNDLRESVTPLFAAAQQDVSFGTSLWIERQ